MRYPIYFFLLLSGFFYLTGQPSEDASLQTGADKGQAQLPYARNAANRSVATLEAEKASKIVKTVVEPVGTNTDMVKRTMPAMVNVASKTPAAEQESAAVKTGTSVSDTDGANVSAKEAVKLAKTDKALEAVQSTTLVKKAAFGTPSRKTLKSAERKKLDWTVFGNRPKHVAAVIPKRVRSRDELDANGLTSERKIVRRKIRKRISLSRSARQAQRRAKNRIRKSRKARIAKRRKSRRYARLNKRNRNIRRIASRRSMRKAKKKSTSRPKRRKFGFGTVGGVTSLLGN